jgi:hypothetical protein
MDIIVKAVVIIAVIGLCAGFMVLVGRKYMK